jgi:hypothetical protein
MNSSAPTRQPWLAVCLAVSAACASAVEPRTAPDPERVALLGAPPTVPWNAPPQGGEASRDEDAPAAAEPRPAPADPCSAADLSNAMLTLCAASSHDEHCVGYSCARTESRTALECAVDAEEIHERLREVEGVGRVGEDAPDLIVAVRRHRRHLPGPCR